PTLPTPTPIPYPTLFRPHRAPRGPALFVQCQDVLPQSDARHRISRHDVERHAEVGQSALRGSGFIGVDETGSAQGRLTDFSVALDRKSTRLNSSHVAISY